MAPSSKTPRWADSKQVADYLHLHLRTVKRLIANGDLPAHRVSVKCLRLDLNEVDAVIKAGRVGKAGRA